jgi:hypothetical protein
MNEQLIHIFDTIQCLADSEDGGVYLSVINTMCNLLWEVNGEYKTGAGFSRTIKCKDLSVTFNYKS